MARGVKCGAWSRSYRATSGSAVEEASRSTSLHTIAPEGAMPLREMPVREGVGAAEPSGWRRRGRRFMRRLLLRPLKAAATNSCSGGRVRGCSIVEDDSTKTSNIKGAHYVVGS